MGWELPTRITVAGQAFAIRSDYRAVLDALAALQDSDLTETEQRVAFVRILVPRWRDLPDWDAAWAALMEFLAAGLPLDAHPGPPLMDWQQDAPLLAPAIDAVLGHSCRRCTYLHWWEFVGAYRQIGEGPFATVVGIRAKRAKGKKLEKWEQEFVRDHPALVKLKPKRSAAEQQEQARLLALLDGR